MLLTIFSSYIKTFCCRIQFRFGWFEWADVHGQMSGDAYEVYLAVDEYLIRVFFHAGNFVDFITLVSNVDQYKLIGGGNTYQQDLGEELAYLAGKTYNHYGVTRVSDITVYQTKCY